jgi:hypothetical protein
MTGSASNCTSENLEIPGLVLPHQAGMTETSVVRIAKGIQRHREWGVCFFAEMLGSNACTVTPFGRTVDIKFRPLF